MIFPAKRLFATPRKTKLIYFQIATHSKLAIAKHFVGLTQFQNKSAKSF